MRLKIWIGREDLTLRQVAERLAAVEPRRKRPTDTMVKRHRDGVDRPGADYERRYEIISDGRVGPADWSAMARERLMERQEAALPPSTSVAEATA